MLLSFRGGCRWCVLVHVRRINGARDAPAQAARSIIASARTNLSTAGLECRVEVLQSGGCVGGSSCQLYRHGMVRLDAGHTVTLAVLAVCAVGILVLYSRSFEHKLRSHVANTSPHPLCPSLVSKIIASEPNPPVTQADGRLRASGIASN